MEYKGLREKEKKSKTFFFFLYIYEEVLVSIKVRAPIPSVYDGIYIVYYKDIGEFQILYSQDICW
jgi:hypothetical protein